MKEKMITGSPLTAKKLAAFLKIVIFAVVCAAAAQGQTTAFTFQGKLNAGGVPANANYDMRFKLFDAAAGSAQIGSTLTVTNVAAVAGIFTVQLDFGAAAFTGGERFVEISISPAGQDNFVTLAPRQKLTSAPYSIQALNATTAQTADNSLNLGGTAASAGGIYALESTAGQTLAGGFLQGSGFSEYSGFWTPAFAPTAANVTIRRTRSDGERTGHSQRPRDADRA